MKYIAHKRFKGQAICGTVNIPAMTECYTENEFLVLDGKKICVVFSENAHIYFAVNEDGCGIQRGRLTSEIIKILVTKDDKYNARWEKVWGDEYIADSRTLELHVQRLRRKMAWEQNLVAVYKVGYRLERFGIYQIPNYGVS